MTRHEHVYRLLLAAYPRPFRTEFREDLVQMFTDLMRRDGRSGAWRRCLVDAAVSVPRLRLEAVMHRDRVTPAITVVAMLVATAGISALAVGGAVGLPVLAFAALVALSQRSRLARALAATPSRRQHRLRMAALLGAIFFATMISWLFQVNRQTDLGAGITLLHNVVGVAALAGALGYFGSALVARPRTGAPGDRSV